MPTCLQPTCLQPQRGESANATKSLVEWRFVLNFMKVPITGQACPLIKVLFQQCLCRRFLKLGCRFWRALRRMQGGENVVFKTK